MPTRLAATLTTAVLGASLLVGCGESSSTGTSATTGGSVQYEAEPVPGDGRTAPIGGAAKSCETGAVETRSLRATGVPCERARQLMHGWQRLRTCAPGGTSRSGCVVLSYRCLATRAQRGTAVSCSRPGESVAFLVSRG